MSRAFRIFLFFAGFPFPKSYIAPHKAGRYCFYIFLKNATGPKRPPAGAFASQSFILS